VTKDQVVSSDGKILHYLHATPSVYMYIYSYFLPKSPICAIKNLMPLARQQRNALPEKWRHPRGKCKIYHLQCARILEL